MAPNNHRLETGVGPTSFKPQASSDKQQAVLFKFQAASMSFKQQATSC
jgi:hypothetical protein